MLRNTKCDSSWKGAVLWNCHLRSVYDFLFLDIVLLFWILHTPVDLIYAIYPQLKSFVTILQFFLRKALMKWSPDIDAKCDKHNYTLILINRSCYYPGGRDCEFWWCPSWLWRNSAFPINWAHRLPLSHKSKVVFLYAAGKSWW